uniref:Uncharacterized protein n=1 Tax=Euplotes harpa TaxID=151035 RepID=A0A7S3N979_9SPIT|mmetsp:Transcript_25597/g.29400  ORF Transcript_25597/g.29400 Transcript_25597/m.29400 type:complete len:300 (+) Transcript_25597:832-1731(+)
MNSENSIIGDFGDIIPVNIDVEQSDVRRHQEWSIGEQKKLSGMLKGRQLNQIEHCEITTIASKLKRSNNSVIAKAKELLSKSNSFPAKRKVTENQLSTYNESESFVTLSRADKDMHASTHSEFEICTDLPDSHKFEYPNLPRKRVIEMILKGMPGCYGTKLQIFEAIQEKYNIPLSSKKTPQYKGFQQCLSKHFKFRKGFYRIRVNDSEYPALCEKLKSFEDCQSWKEKTFFILNQFPEKKARIDQIVQSFRTTLNTNSGDSHRAKSSVAVWEKNILKIFSKYDSLFDTTLAKSVYFLQ